MYSLRKVIIPPGRLVYLPVWVQAIANGKLNATTGIIRGDEGSLDELGLQSGTPSKGICLPVGTAAIMLINLQEEEATISS